MRRLFLALACCATIAVSCFAADAPSDRQRELADELVTVMHVSELWPQMIDSMLKNVEGSMSPQELARYRVLLTRDVNGAELMRNIYISIYFKYYTEDDIRALIAFYKTPLGQKMVTSMPQLTADIYTEVQRTLTPKIMTLATQIAEEYANQRQTERDLRAIGTALEAWALSEGTGYPDPSDMTALAAKLKPVADHLPVNDPWGHPYAYAVSPDRKHYRVVSAGSDGVFEHDSLAVTSEIPAAPRYSEGSSSDFIYADGHFVQLPKSQQ